MPRTTKLIMRCLGTSMSLLWATSCAVAQTGVGDEPSPHINPGGVGDDGGSDSDNNSDGFRYYFSITSNPQDKAQGRDWAGQLRFDEEIMTRDFVILYQHLTGNYPKPGPHLSTDPAYMRAHLEQLAIDVASQIPDPDFSGIAILDYEMFPAIWDRVWNRASDAGPEAKDHDFRDDWTDHIRASHPEFNSMSDSDQEQLLRETWEAAVRDLFRNSINKAREVRPNAKWGFYGYPYRFFNLRREVPRDVISYGDGSHNGSRLNDRLQWMWDAVDLIAPSLYARRVVLETDDGSCEDVCSAADDMLFIENMIGEARRVGNGKPVYPFISTYYNTPHDCFDGEELNDANLRSQIMGPALLGADGACLWGGTDVAEDRDRWQSFLDRRIMPLMAEGVAHRGGGRNQASEDGHDDAGEESDNQQFTSRLDSRGGAVSKAADRPRTAGATKVSSRKSTRTPAIKFDPRTDRVSKPALSLEAILAAKRRAELKKLAAADD